jgi:iron(III) transport system ATP-binding protein
VSRALELVGLEIDAGRTCILGPLDLALDEGEHVLVAGPSGSGKTTLLRAVAGLALPARGTIALFGKPASAPGRLLIAPERRGIGFVFQGAALWPHMSAAGQIEFVLRCAGVPRRERAARAPRLLADVGLAGFERRMPATLSGGEASRVALARALAGEPRLLLLDEPAAALDGDARSALLAHLAELSRARRWTALHVTHHPDEMRGLATRVLKLERGRLVEAGGRA